MTKNNKKKKEQTLNEKSVLANFQGLKLELVNVVI